MDQSAVVVGAGIVGTLSAWRLARAGWRVTVLEAEHIGAGSSSRTAAGIRQQFSTPATVVGMRYAVDFYRRFPEEVGGTQIPIVQNGYLFLLNGPLQAAAARVAVQRAAGLEEVELLDPAQAARRFPWVDPERLTGATWCPTDGFLRPEVVYQEAAEAGRRLGVTYVQRAPVTAARATGDRLTAVRGGDRWFEADLFLDCTNAWSPRLAAVLGAAPLRIDPLKRYLWFLQRAGPLSSEALLAMPLVITPGGTYCRPENAESLLVGHAHDAKPEPDFSWEDQDHIEAAFSHRSGTDSQAYAAWAALADAIPALGEFAGCTATTSGYYGSTPDHNPYLGYDPLRKNLIRLVGYSGHGAMMAPFAARIGELLAQAGQPLPAIEVLGRTVDLGCFSPDRAPGDPEQLVI